MILLILGIGLMLISAGVAYGTDNEDAQRFGTVALYASCVIIGMGLGDLIGAALWG